MARAQGISEEEFLGILNRVNVSYVDDTVMRGADGPQDYLKLYSVDYRLM